MTSFSRQVSFPPAKWILPRPSIHSQTCHFENLSKVTLLWRLKPLFHWAENCYWIWGWIIGRHVPTKNPAEKKRKKLCFIVTLKPMTFGCWAVQMVWVLLGGTLLSFVYEPRHARGLKAVQGRRQFTLSWWRAVNGAGRNISILTTHTGIQPCLWKPEQ